MMQLAVAFFQPSRKMENPSTRLVSVSGTGLRGMGMDRGASIHVTAVIRAVSTRLWVENRELDEAFSFVMDIDVILLLLRQKAALC